ncbi:transglycosylase domain-containing protein [Synechocystis sp. PCC 7509]|uniref:transglycosylase domain-containing protein n=1 Tax=Synechocystis sp. PCC 7509 TaxID=927677 RepID=UPI0002ABECB4|nr:penicillin-binding protein 1A [Synechocystis sp. PCC 7509]
MSKLIPWLKDRTNKISDSAPREEVRTEKLTLVERIKNLPKLVYAKIPKDKPLYRYYWFWLILVATGGTVAWTVFWLAIERSLPEATELYTFVRDDTLTIKAGDGGILQQRGPATREQLKLSQIPKPLIQAFIASEDRRFYNHHGVDYQGIVRAFVNNMRSRNLGEGGSTITQQLARILFLNQERTLVRKFREISLSQKIEQKLTKEEILERYLNLVYLGSGAYGVADASWVYFSKPANKLTLAEMATIAGLAPAPSLYSPVVNPTAARRRRDLVLQRMQEDGVITPQIAKTATSTPTALKPSLPKRLQVEAPYFTTYIQQELPKYISPELIEAGGLTVETTLNPQWQKAAETAVKNTVAQNGRWQHFEEASLVSIDPRNGEIKAMVGGKDFKVNQFNRVTQAQRQPGSTFKGFVYAAAIASGMSPYKSYIDAPYIVEGYEPLNYDRSYRGWMTASSALISSINTIAVKVLIDVGFEPTIKLAHSMGIKSELKPTYSLALGSNEVNLLELTSAYGTLATQGKHIETHGIRRILNRSGEVIYSSKYQSKQVLDPGSAAIMTWMLKSVVQSGTGRAAQLHRPVAGKTGTSDEARDLWFIGYIPQVVTGVWLGNDNNSPTWGSSSTAAYTWHQFMAQAVEKMPIVAFPSRPKLEGRKGSIKAQKLKPKRVISRRIRSKRLNENREQNNLQAIPESNRQRRRNRRYEKQNPETTVPRNRNYRSDPTNNASPRRLRKPPESTPPKERSQPKVRIRSIPQNTPTKTPPQTPTRSWRERLRPVESPRYNKSPVAPAPNPTPGFGSDG